MQARKFMSNVRRDSVCQKCGKANDIGARIAFIPAERAAQCEACWNAGHPTDLLNMEEKQDKEKRFVVVIKEGEDLPIEQRITFEGVKSRKPFTFSVETLIALAHDMVELARHYEDARTRTRNLMEKLDPADRAALELMMRSKNAERQFGDQQDEQKQEKKEQGEHDGCPAL